jgi:hypothetical protein
MENQPNPVMKMAMTSGLYLGLALVLNTVIFYVLGKPFADASGYISYTIIIGGIAYGMYAFGNSAGEEGFPYGRAVGLGTLQALFASIILAFFTFILYEFIDPTLLEKLMAFTEEKLLSRGMSDDQVETMINMSKKMMTPTIMSISQIFSLTLMGLIFSLILALIFKKKPSNPFHEVDSE